MGMIHDDPMILVSEKLGGLEYFSKFFICFGILFVSAVSQLVRVCAGSVYIHIYIYPARK